MSLLDVNIKDTYSSANANDILFEFYNPVIEQAAKYDRITGFFSPAVLAIASRGFAGLISTGGKIRLITSVQLDDRIYKSIIENNHTLDDTLLDGFDLQTIKSELDRDYLSVFAWLYRTGQLEMKVAVMSKERSMLHQKIGIVTDADGNSISFSGSNNETPNGWQHNIEQFKVFKGWNPYTESFYESDKAEFDVLWDNLSSKASIMSLDDAIKNKLIQIIEKNRKGDINTVVNRIQKREHINRIRIKPARGNDVVFQTDNKEIIEQPSLKHQDKNTKDTRSLFDYQKHAIQHWFSNQCISIFEMATGTGKTYTTINALKEFGEKNGYLRGIVVVPLTTLTMQWQNDIQKILPDYRIINTSVDNNWRQVLHSLSMSKLLNGKPENFIIITSYKMFPTESFLDAVSKVADDYILIADEMHNLVTDRCIDAVQKDSFKFKLGLSATPTRLWKPEESAFISKVFGDNSFSYDLKDAINAKFLVPFNYHPVFTYMDSEEYEQYVELSKAIAQLYAASNGTGDNNFLNKKLIARSRLKKNTSSKIPELSKLIKNLNSSNNLHHALIYVDNEDFLSELQKMLSENNIITTKFVGNTPLDDRVRIIKNLRNKTIKAIVAIKCLDEGVDIPSAQSAFFLSNNTDPREYVQRLGRVLRRDDEGDKSSADIYDFIVLPPKSVEFDSESDRKIARNLIRNELRRSAFFQELAMNGDEAKQLIENRVDDYGFVFDDKDLVYNNSEEDL
ncbi:MAG TPA: DEAD/DEAH box helicase family protein [Candidatus Saccharibacteria bacterium]|nr:DEAD/DEAH box helicase family protein [Candidatus Saccharibacteria bacterium]